MFIDFLALMLLNLAIGLIIFGWFFFRHLEENRKAMAPGFLMTGFIAIVTGLFVCFHWPLPSSYNVVYGEPAVLYGVLFFTTGLALLFDWDLTSIGIFGFFAGVAAILIGIRMMSLNMSKEPWLTMLGFIVTGLAGLAALPGYWLRRYPIIRALVMIAAFGGAVIWGFNAFAAYWGHPESFIKWAPAYKG